MARVGAASLPGDSGTIWRRLLVITAGGVGAHSTQRVEAGVPPDILQCTGPLPRRMTQPQRSTAAGLRSPGLDAGSGASEPVPGAGNQGPIRVQMPGAPRSCQTPSKKPTGC